jgi:hypothetical protein
MSGALQSSNGRLPPPKTSHRLTFRRPAGTIKEIVPPFGTVSKDSLGVQAAVAVA